MWRLIHWNFLPPFLTRFFRHLRGIRRMFVLYFTTSSISKSLWRMWYWVWNVGRGMILTAKSRSSRRKTSATVTISTTNSTWTGPRSNLGLCCERPSTDCMVGFLDFEATTRLLSWATYCFFRLNVLNDSSIRTLRHYFFNVMSVLGNWQAVLNNWTDGNFVGWQPASRTKAVIDECSRLVCGRAWMKRRSDGRLDELEGWELDW